jgi:hypothetical protein
MLVTVYTPLHISSTYSPKLCVYYINTATLFFKLHAINYVTTFTCNVSARFPSLKQNTVFEKYFKIL